MDLVRPITVTDAVLASSTVAETETLWAIGTSYSAGAAVYRVIDDVHIRFVSLENANLGNTPESSPSKWRDEGPTNRWAMFDATIDSQTTNADEIEVVLDVPASERLDVLYLAGLDAVSVRVQVYDALTAATEFDETFNLSDVSGIGDWFDYYYDPLEYASELGIVDLPYGAGSTLTVTIEKTGGIAACGALVTGFRKSLGGTRWGVATGIRDYSKFLEDDFGNRVLVPGAYRKTARATATLENRLKDAIERELARCRATVRLYIADPDYITHWILGTAKWSVDMNDPPDRAECSLEMESNI